MPTPTVILPPHSELQRSKVPKIGDSTKSLHSKRWTHPHPFAAGMREVQGLNQTTTMAGMLALARLTLRQLMKHPPFRQLSVTISTQASPKAVPAMRFGR